MNSAFRMLKMVGGVVIEVAELPDRIFVDCRDRNRRDTCAIYVEKCPASLMIEIGDSLWWQGGYAFHTPAANRLSETESNRLGHRAGTHYDIKIKRIGFSGVKLQRKESDQ